MAKTSAAEALKEKPKKQSKKQSKKENKAPKHKSSGGHLRRNLGIIAASTVTIITAAFAVTAVAANKCETIYPNTYVAGQNVSNMSDSELADFLNKTYNSDLLKNEKFTLICKDKKLELNASDLNISFDNNAFAEKIKISGRSGGILKNTYDYAKRYFVPQDVNPVVSYDKEKLAASFNEVTKDYEIEPVGHTFVMNADSVTIIGPVNGLKADRDIAMDTVEDQISKMTPAEVNLVPESVKPEAINKDEFYKWLTSDAESAFYEKVDGKVIVHESKPKCDISRESVEQALSDLKSSPDNTVTVAATVTQPAETADVLTANLYKDKLGSYTTNYGASSAARANNVRLATTRIDGTELMPGEEFSYDKTILPRTSANGYMAAPVYVGNKVESGLGGGICQPSSTLYAAALYANLEILERHNHSLTVSYMPPGMDATIAQGVLDLRFRNNLDYPIKISASAEGGILTFNIYGYNPSNTSVELQRSSGGGSYYLTRVVKQNGQVVKTEKMGSSTYGTKEH